MDKSEQELIDECIQITKWILDTINKEVIIVKELRLEASYYCPYFNYLLCRFEMPMDWKIEDLNSILGDLNKFKTMMENNIVDAIVENKNESL